MSAIERLIERFDRKLPVTAREARIELAKLREELADMTIDRDNLRDACATHKPITLAECIRRVRDAAKLRQQGIQIFSVGVVQVGGCAGNLTPEEAAARLGEKPTVGSVLPNNGNWTSAPEKPAPTAFVPSKALVAFESLFSTDDGYIGRKRDMAIDVRAVLRDLEARIGRLEAK
jgi:hypothetical protein